MKSSLIPEKPLLVYPSLAATVGLEEATMLAVLAELADQLSGANSNGFTWYVLHRELVERKMPFWNDQDVQRVSTNLRDKGIIIIASAPYSSYGELKFAFNEKTAQRQETPQAAPTAPPVERQPAPGAVKNFIAPNWQPNQEVLAQLAQHSIPSQFALQQVPEFVTYWRERGDAQRSWGSKFIKHVIHKWRNYETFQVQREQETPMTRDWRPSNDAMDVLTRHAGISRDFIEDAIPEFVLYWQERGDVLRTWNSKFIQHVRRQWLRYKSELKHDTEPRRLPRNWKPDEMVYDVLRMANIDLQFAHDLVPEFVLYWCETNQVYSAWNERFLKHVKHHWAKKHSLNQSFDNRSTRELSLEEQLNDRSWAE